MLKMKQRYALCSFKNARGYKLSCIGKFIPAVTAVKEEIISFENAVFFQNLFFRHFAIYAQLGKVCW
ncbi:MAG: hypothetical protein KF734_03595 [Saprospiraceae bacterium]|nr:hypothetical protein [Saprospiraceae bacterium]